jgi:membrane protein
MLKFLVLLRRSVWRTFEHNGFAIAKAAAYSGILTLFPAFLVFASILEASDTTPKFFVQISYAIGKVLPKGTSGAVLDYFDLRNQKPVHVIFSASLVMLTAASGVMVSLMDGFRRAYGIQTNPWGFWYERAMAFLLIPLSLLPMAFATVLVAFGNQIENWLTLQVWYELRPLIFLTWRISRWIISALTSVSVIALIYHMSIPRTQSWRRVLPGASLATVMWFGATLAFGWYVTRYANYNVIYGSLGAAIALLVWLYLVSIVVLIGAEFNALIFPKREMDC